ncbi:MAG: nuclear transport factor 2 family protein [Erythrobacter sp.]
MRRFTILSLLLGLLVSAPLRAEERVEIDPVEDVVVPLFDAVLAENMEQASALVAKDAQLFAMFNPSGETGQDSIRQFPIMDYFALVTRNYENIAFIDRTYSVANDGRTVWMEASGDLRLEPTGAPYRNRYVFKFTINEEGKVSELKEWVNTVTLTQQGVTARQDSRDTDP